MPHGNNSIQSLFFWEYDHTPFQDQQQMHALASFAFSHNFTKASERLMLEAWDF